MKKLNILFLTMSLLSLNVALAQYPKIPEQVKKETDEMMEKARSRSEEAWAKALPVIDEYAKQGKTIYPLGFQAV